MDTETFTERQFAYLFHHLFLPRQLPGSDDDTADDDSFLIDFVINSLGEFLYQTDSSYTDVINSAIYLMKN